MYDDTQTITQPAEAPDPLEDQMETIETEITGAVGAVIPPPLETDQDDAERTNQVLNPMPLTRECSTHGPWSFDGTEDGSECPGCARAWIEERAAYERRVEGQICNSEITGHTPGSPVLECSGCQGTKESVDAFFKSTGFVPQPEPAPKAQKRTRKKSEQTEAPAIDREPETFEELKAARDRAREVVNQYEAKMREMLEAERARKLAELEELNRLGSELGLTA